METTLVSTNNSLNATQIGNVEATLLSSLYKGLANGGTDTNSLLGFLSLRNVTLDLNKTIDASSFTKENLSKVTPIFFALAYQNLNALKSLIEYANQTNQNIDWTAKSQIWNATLGKLENLTYESITPAQLSVKQYCQNIAMATNGTDPRRIVASTDDMNKHLIAINYLLDLGVPIDVSNLFDNSNKYPQDIENPARKQPYVRLFEIIADDRRLNLNSELGKIVERIIASSPKSLLRLPNNDIVDYGANRHSFDGLSVQHQIIFLNFINKYFDKIVDSEVSASTVCDYVSIAFKDAFTQIISFKPHTDDLSKFHNSNKTKMNLELFEVAIKTFGLLHVSFPVQSNDMFLHTLRNSMRLTSTHPPYVLSVLEELRESLNIQDLINSLKDKEFTDLTKRRQLFLGALNVAFGKLIDEYLEATRQIEAIKANVDKAYKSLFSKQ